MRVSIASILRDLWLKYAVWSIQPGDRILQGLQKARDAFKAKKPTIAKAELNLARVALDTRRTGIQRVLFRESMAALPSNFRPEVEKGLSRAVHQNISEEDAKKLWHMQAGTAQQGDVPDLLKTALGKIEEAAGKAVQMENAAKNGYEAGDQIAQEAVALIDAVEAYYRAAEPLIQIANLPQAKLSPQ